VEPRRSGQDKDWRIFARAQRLIDERFNVDNHLSNVPRSLPKPGFNCFKANLRRAGALRGDTPVRRCWDRHDRLPVGAALTVPRRRRRLGLCITMLNHNESTHDGGDFLGNLRIALPGPCPLTVVWGGFAAHRLVARGMREGCRTKLRFKFRSGYSLRLGAVEHVLGHTKYTDLANCIPSGVDGLRSVVILTLLR